MFLELNKRIECGTLVLMKEAIWHPNAIEEIRRFPNQVKKNLGYLIYKLQIGEVITAPKSKPFKSIEVGVSELRIKDSSGAYRVFYFFKTQKGVMIIHAFKKKTQKTPKKEIDKAKNNLKELLNES